MDIVKLKNDVKSVVAFRNSDLAFKDTNTVFRIIMNTATASIHDPFQAVYLYLSRNNFSRILMGRQKVRARPPKKHLEISTSLPIFTS
jgi:hypothetical protein